MLCMGNRQIAMLRANRCLLVMLFVKNAKNGNKMMFSELSNDVTQNKILNFNVDKKIAL